jgi:hypothetical protein
MRERIETVTFLARPKKGDDNLLELKLFLSVLLYEFTG